MALTEQTKWKLIQNNIENGALVHHQIESFNNFIDNLSHIVNNQRITFSERHYIEFYNLYVDKPSIIENDRIQSDLLPHVARTRDLTYESTVFISIKEVNVDNDTNEENISHYHRIELCKIPTMLGSRICHLNGIAKYNIKDYNECEFDSGGYFIVKGKERVLISQLRNCYNKPLVFDDTTENITCEIRSMSSGTGHSILSKVILTENIKFKLSIALLKNDIPVIYIFNALGFHSYDDIYNLINIKDESVVRYIKSILRNRQVIGGVSPDTPFDLPDDINVKNALIEIGRYSNSVIKSGDYEAYGRQFVDIELFPHLGVQSGNMEKALFISSMIRKIIYVKMNKLIFDDRDDFINKRIETPGVLCGELFKQLFKKFKDYISNTVEKKKQNYIDIINLFIRNKSITSGIRYCFSTGNWGVQRTNYIRQGVSQVLSRLSYGSTISHKRRVSIPIGKESKNTKIRQIHPSQIMFICPCETPEGQSVGIVLNLSLFTRITNDDINNVLLTTNHIKSFKNIKQISSNTLTTNYTMVFVNNSIIGSTSDYNNLLNEIYESRINKYIDYDTSVYFDKVLNEIHIYTDSGRMTRPLFNVDNNKVVFDDDDCDKSWDELVCNNKIKYLDNIEVQSAVIALNHSMPIYTKYDYCEIHPSLMLGVMGSIIPWPDHSQSPRNCYQTSMGKQSMSIYATTFNIRTDTITHVITTPQKPIVNTKIAGFMGFNDMPSGCNVICAIACYTGFNQEDSLIINKSAIQRGLFHAYSYRTHVDQENRHSIHLVENIKVPNIDIQKSDLNYNFLGDDGIIKTRINKQSVYVKKGDVIIGKVVEETTKGSVSNVTTDVSLAIKKGEEGYIDRIIDEITPDGYRIVKVVIRTERIPEIGDKFASRSAQKGTCGIVYAQEDMPFTSDGITPDIIINPHCIPSRMTVNQLMETAFSKSCVIKGKLGDATPFQQNTDIGIANQIKQELNMTGFNGDGTETMYNGFDGNVLGSVFIGPVFYQRLKHLVRDKMHARSSGSVTTLTRQPLEGRSRDGGLRFGEMERDAMISHGASMFLKDRLCDQSDPYHIYVCDKCKQISKTKDKCHCSNDTTKKVETPYVTKLLIQELQAVGIKTNIKVK